MIRGFTSIVYKESIHVTRDPRSLFFMVIIPALQLTIFGYAIDLDVRNIPTVVYNLDGRAESRDLIDIFRNSDYFHIIDYVNSDEELQTAIVRGDAKVAVKIPPDYTDQLVRGGNTSIQVLIDGSDSTVAMQALNVANAIALRKSLAIVSNQLGNPARPPIEARPRVLFNPDMRTPNFMIPGLLAIVMQIVTMFLTAFAIVREKEQGTLEQLMVTPVSRLGLMLGKLVPFGIIGTVETTLVMCIMRFLFGVPIAGNLLVLAGFAMLFLFCALGFGLLISTLAQTQIQAIQFSVLIVMPSVLLSGFVFPQETMPLPIYIIGQFLPATYFVRILRGVILRGAGFAELWHQGVFLAIMGVLLITVSTARFRKTLA
ncbi:MAG: ABC transporter permease [Candidatus Hydrogenedentes bacterium]|nr:ABC transporter permease [Candidatus Hydrogenedentota bacterium]